MKQAPEMNQAPRLYAQCGARGSSRRVLVLKDNDLSPLRALFGVRWLIHSMRTQRLPIRHDCKPEKNSCGVRVVQTMPTRRRDSVAQQRRAAIDVCDFELACKECSRHAELRCYGWMEWAGADEDRRDISVELQEGSDRTMQKRSTLHALSARRANCLTPSTTTSSSSPSVLWGNDSSPYTPLSSEPPVCAKAHGNSDCS